MPWILKEQWDSIYCSWSDMLAIDDILSFMQRQGKFKFWSKHARLRTCIKEIRRSRNCNLFFRAEISFVSQVSSGHRKQKNDRSTPKFEFYPVPGKPYFEFGDYSIRRKHESQHHGKKNPFCMQIRGIAKLFFIPTIFMTRWGNQAGLRYKLTGRNQSKPFQ